MTRNSVRTAVAEAVGELTGFSVERITDADDLVDDLGVDSMVSVRLLVAVEDRVGASVPDGSEGSLVGMRTVGELVDRLTSIFTLGVDESATSSS